MVEPNETANAIIAKALEDAGVPPRSIAVPPVEEAAPAESLPSLDGLPKGQVKGDELEPVEVVVPVPGAEPPAPAPGEPIVPPLSKADIEAAIAETSSKFQGIMDKKINALDFQMRQTIGALNQFFQAQEDTGISGLSPEEQVQKRLERLEKGGQSPKIQIQQTPQTDAVATQLYQYLVDMADVAGVKPDDKRLDWGADLQVAQTSEIVNRFKASVKKALVEDQTKAIQELKGDGDKAIAQLRKKTGVDKVSVAGPSGAGLPDLSKMTPMQKIDYGFQQQEVLSQVSK